MSVLNIENIVKKGVASKTLNKVLLSLFKIILEVLFEESPQVPKFTVNLSLGKFLLECIKRDSIWDELNNSTVRRVNEDLIRPQVDVKASLVKYPLQSLHQLYGQHFLPQIVISFHNHRLKLISLILLKIALLIASFN